MAQPTAWSQEGQIQRRHELHALIRERLRPLLDETGRSECLIRWDQPRESLRGAVPFLSGDAAEVTLGNQILRYVRDELDVKPGEPRPFESSILAGILATNKQALEADTLTFAEKFLLECLPHGTTRDFQFHGFNDNMPVMWSWALRYGGEAYDNACWRDIAWANIAQLRDMLMRRGTVSEYGVGYCTHRLTGIAAIVEHSQNDDLRAMARDCEARIWAELAGHWNPSLGQVCGGSMRGDMRNAGLFSVENYALFRQVFGDGILLPGIDWRDAFDGEPDNIREMGLDPTVYKFSGEYGYAAEFADFCYHVPDDVAKLFLRKEPGFVFACTAENGYTNEGVYCKKEPVYDKTAGVIVKHRLSDELVVIPHFPDHGAQPHGLVTWHGRHVALGTTTTNRFGTSNALRCHYRRSAELGGVADLGSVHTRFNLNDKQPCGRTKNAYWNTPELRAEKGNRVSLYDDMGRHHCLQQANIALCLQVPSPVETWQVATLCTDIFFRNDHGQLGRFWLGDREATTFPVEAAESQAVTIDEGAVYLGIVPLIGRHGERGAALRLRDQGEFRILSLINLEREPAPMTEREMRKSGNGFVFIARDAADYASFAAFQAEVHQVQVIDQLYGGVRRVHVRSGDTRLSMFLCPYTDTVMYSAINGQDATIPKLSFSNGLERQLPLMHPTERLDPDQEWRWLEVQTNREHEPYNPVD